MKNDPIIKKAIVLLRAKFQRYNAIYNVIENQKLYSEFVLQRAKKKLDIRKTALDYLTFYEKSNS